MGSTLILLKSIFIIYCVKNSLIAAFTVEKQNVTHRGVDSHNWQVKTYFSSELVIGTSISNSKKCQVKISHNFIKAISFDCWCNSSIKENSRASDNFGFSFIIGGPRAHGRQVPGTKVSNASLHQLHGTPLPKVIPQRYITGKEQFGMHCTLPTSHLGS